MFVCNTAQPVALHRSGPVVQTFPEDSSPLTVVQVNPTIYITAGNDKSILATRPQAHGPFPHLLLSTACAWSSEMGLARWHTDLWKSLLKFSDATAIFPVAALVSTLRPNFFAVATKIWIGAPLLFAGNTHYPGVCRGLGTKAVFPEGYASYVTPFVNTRTDTFTAPPRRARQGGFTEVNAEATGVTEQLTISEYYPGPRSLSDLLENPPTRTLAVGLVASLGASIIIIAISVVIWCRRRKRREKEPKKSQPAELHGEGLLHQLDSESILKPESVMEPQELPGPEPQEMSADGVFEAPAYRAEERVYNDDKEQQV
ncbi:hypothetical protein BJ508DRAFT_375237 [Ascobolus immersus RN42]|uniref:Uncharacterized protein n=1 Tax=Ascobolus immersus RN42 TaxID=1160509 RepID=A0A3N4IGJ2_ASCIM|nr:hypothetical protein BJ508DRAFT_375237 [Ascobolus immersus RN42]